MDEFQLRDWLIRIGMSATQAEAKARLFDRAESSIKSSSTASLDPSYSFIPGRIEFLGKHTDYAGGRSLICAIERGVCLVASAREDAVLRIVDASRDSEVAFTIGADLRPPSGTWTNYPMTLARRLARNFPGRWRGAD